MISYRLFLPGPVMRQSLCLAVLMLALAVPRAGAAELRIVDDAGKTIKLEAAARRIIPLYAGLGETLLAMGLADRVVGRTVSDASISENLPSVGTHMRPTPELVAGLRPDLVVQLEGREEAATAAEALQRMGIKVARFRIASFADLYSCIERLGILTDEGEAAAALVQNLQERLAGVGAQMWAFSEQPGIFFEVRYPNLLGAGRGSMINEIINAAGGKNCLARYPDRMVRLSEEVLALHNPDIYLVQHGPMNKSPVAPALRPSFANLAAVRNGFVRTVPESLYSRPGPGSVKAVEDLAKIISQWHMSACRMPDKRE